MKSIFLWLVVFIFSLTLISCGPSDSVKEEQVQEEKIEEVAPQEEEMGEEGDSEEEDFEKEEIEEEEEFTSEKNLEEEAPKIETIQTVKKTPQQKVLFHKVFYPFFTNRGEVPYKIKISVENTIPTLKKLIQKNPKALILIKGYTSKTGPLKQNKKLSTWRASEMAGYLSWKSGIPLKKFRYQGFGKIHKKSSLAKRVEILVINP